MSRPPRQIVLASSSTYRRAQLQTLLPDFSYRAPDIDESARPGEAAQALALRLSAEKAQAVAIHYPDALIIGADQVAECEGALIGKPGDHARAVQQLRQLRGRSVAFHSGLALFDSASGVLRTQVTTTVSHYRAITDEQIEQYLLRDQPYDCAGSCRCESLGIAILDAVHSDDPSALIGLPLIALTRLLLAAGVDVLSPACI